MKRMTDDNSAGTLGTESFHTEKPLLDKATAGRPGTGQ
jgi:hypothetical protein